MSMHGSLTGDLKSTDLNQLDTPKDGALMVPGQKRPSHEQFRLVMNPQYEYKLPRGLGLAVNSRTYGTETASEIVPHDAGEASEGNGSADTLTPPSEIRIMLQHHSLGLEMKTCSGVSICSSGLYVNHRSQDGTQPFP